MKKSIAIQMDNIEKIDYEFDTSFLIGYEAQERDYDIFYYNPKDLFIKENTIQASGYYLELFLNENNYLFHAGTQKQDDKIYAVGGRVLNFISLSNTYSEAKKNIHENLEKLNWEKGFFRKDIGYKVIDK